jgi:hypothetical protein
LSPDLKLNRAVTKLLEASSRQETPANIFDLQDDPGRKSFSFDELSSAVTGARRPPVRIVASIQPVSFAADNGKMTPLPMRTFEGYTFTSVVEIETLFH